MSPRGDIGIYAIACSRNKGLRAEAHPETGFNQTKSKRSAFMTFTQALTKSLTNFSFASDWA